MRADRIVSTYIMGDDSGNVKIGKSTDIYRRLRQLSCGNPTIRLLFYADRDIEDRLHRKYKTQNVRSIGREWFRLTEQQIEELVIAEHFSRCDEQDIESFLIFLRGTDRQIDITDGKGNIINKIKA